MPYFESLDGAIVSFLNYGNGLAIDLKLSGKLSPYIHHPASLQNGRWC